MESETVAVGRLTELVAGYARRVYAAVLAQHPAASVCSPLGVWLLLAACAPAAHGENRRALEEALGCSAEEAAELLSTFMRAPPPALKAAIAIWASVADASEALVQWVRELPGEVESGYMPTKAEADAWADRHTLGLIKSFPLGLDEFTRIVLASALATKVSWEVPFELTPADSGLGERSPWRGEVARLLCDQAPRRMTMIADTASAGRVAVHAAIAKEDLTVLSLSADPAVPRERVLESVHEVASTLLGEQLDARRCSLFDLELGAGHSWEIAEREIATHVAGQRQERITDAMLPAWRVEGQLDLLASPGFGSEPALKVMQDVIGPRSGDKFAAKQVAVASYTRFGFEAAAITAFAIAVSAHRAPAETGVERTATLRFDHPYAVVAFAGRLGQESSGTSTGLVGLPLFTAWIAAPEEPEEEAPAESDTSRGGH